MVINPTYTHFLSLEIICSQFYIYHCSAVFYIYMAVLPAELVVVLPAELVAVMPAWLVAVQLAYSSSYVFFHKTKQFLSHANIFFNHN